MNYEQFVENYEPIKNHLSEGGAFNGTMFETYGNEMDLVKEVLAQAGNKRIWTYVGEGNNEMIVPGLRFVNRLGYFITQEEWEDENDFVYFD